MKTIKAKIITNIKAGDTLYFRPNRNNLGQPIKRKVYGISFCTMREDNIHSRIEYRLKNTVYSPTLDSVIALNPHIETVEITLPLLQGKKRGVYMGEEADLHLNYIEHNGIKERVGRYWINIGGGDIWFINN